MNIKLSGAVIVCIPMLLSEFLRQKNISEDLCKLFAETIADAAVKIREAVENGTVAETIGSINAFGEKQIKADLAAHEILASAFQDSRLVSSFVSEESEGVVALNSEGKFTVVFDPLDGSSLADVNFSVGTIIGVFETKNLENGGIAGKTPGDMVAAAYFVYGPRTTLVLCAGRGTGVHEFLMNGNDGRFHLHKENLTLSDEPRYFSPGNLRAASERTDYLSLLKFWAEKKYTLRYSGGMVPDLNHIFIKGGGIFSYPAYSETPEGKLRLVFECGPMAYLAEEAGGAATDGVAPITSKKILDAHQRTPIFIGSKAEVARCEAFLSGKK